MKKIEYTHGVCVCALQRRINFRVHMNVAVARFACIHVYLFHLCYVRIFFGCYFAAFLLHLYFTICCVREMLLLLSFNFIAP